MTNDPWGREFTRRSLIQRSAGLALGASAVGGLAACGVGSQKTSTTATETRMPIFWAWACAAAMARNDSSRERGMGANCSRSGEHGDGRAT